MMQQQTELQHSEAWRDVVAGKRRGLLAAAFRWLFWVCAQPYGIVVRIRNWAYSTGMLTVHRAAVPVVSIGNLTVGGTGKTPVAALIARWFRERGVRVAFLSRGYGADSSGSNDEALVLERLCPDVPHLQQPNRVQAAAIAVEELASQVLILDDGFQHRRLHRDLDIVLIDATQPWGFGHVLPRGMLREPVSGLSRARLVCLTRVNQVSHDQRIETLSRIKRLAPQAGVAEIAFLPGNLINTESISRPLSELRGTRCGMVCGIGNPQSFRGLLQSAGIEIVAVRNYPDHYSFDRESVQELQNWVAKQPVEAVLCTLKDLVKLPLTHLAGRPFWALEMETRIVSGEREIERHLHAVLENIATDAAENATDDATFETTDDVP